MQTKDSVPMLPSAVQSSQPESVSSDTGEVVIVTSDPRLDKLRNRASSRRGWMFWGVLCIIVLFLVACVALVMFMLTNARSPAKASCISTQSPMHGTLGSCVDVIGHGAQCSLKCSEGYSLCGPRHLECNDGVFIGQQRCVGCAQGCASCLAGQPDVCLSCSHSYSFSPFYPQTCVANRCVHSPAASMPAHIAQNNTVLTSISVSNTLESDLPTPTSSPVSFSPPRRLPPSTTPPSEPNHAQQSHNESFALFPLAHGWYRCYSRADPLPKPVLVRRFSLSSSQDQAENTLSGVGVSTSSQYTPRDLSPDEWARLSPGEQEALANQDVYRGVAHGDSCEVECDDGYVMMGDEPRCDHAQFVWPHGVASSCQAMDCGAMSLERLSIDRQRSHINVGNCTRSLSTGEHCVLSCEIGFEKVEGTSARVECVGVKSAKSPRPLSDTKPEDYGGEEHPPPHVEGLASSKLTNPTLECRALSCSAHAPLYGFVECTAAGSLIHPASNSYSSPSPLAAAVAESDSVDRSIHSDLSTDTDTETDTDTDTISGAGTTQPSSSSSRVPVDSLRASPPLSPPLPLPLSSPHSQQECVAPDGGHVWVKCLPGFFTTQHSVQCHLGQLEAIAPCQPCASPCATCQGEANACRSCIQGYYWNENTQDCQRCGFGCATCTIKECTLCKGGATLHDGRCTYECPVDIVDGRSYFEHSVRRFRPSTSLHLPFVPGENKQPFALSFGIRPKMQGTLMTLFSTAMCEDSRLFYTDHGGVKIFLNMDGELCFWSGETDDHVSEWICLTGQVAPLNEWSAWSITHSNDAVQVCRTDRCMCTMVTPNRITSNPYALRVGGEGDYNVCRVYIGDMTNITLGTNFIHILHIDTSQSASGQ